MNIVASLPVSLVCTAAVKKCLAPHQANAFSDTTDVVMARVRGEETIYFCQWFLTFLLIPQCVIGCKRCRYILSLYILFEKVS